jgi:hypothetical protein
VPEPAVTEPSAPEPEEARPLDPAMELFSVILDDVIDEDAAIAAALYRRYVKLDQLRQVSENQIVASLGGPDAVSAQPHGWNAIVQAREELMFELSCALRLPASTVAILLWEGKILLHELPRTAEALRLGEISGRHASVMVAQAESIPEEARGDFEEAVLPYARNLTVSKFTTVARKKRESLHPESIVDRHRHELSERRVWVTPEADGMAHLTAYLSAEIAYAAFDRLTSIAVHDDGTGHHDNVGDDRHDGQKRADALADLLLMGDTCSATAAGEFLASPIGDSALDGVDKEVGADDTPLTDATESASASATTCGGGEPPTARGVAAPPWGPGMGRNVGHGIRPKVLVTVPVLTLLGKNEEAGTLEGYGPIDPETARDLARHAPSFTRILIHPVTSSIIDIDRTTYAVPADLRLALRVQDETCRGVTCNKSAKNCDVDHNVEHSTGGKTQISNLCHLCPTCHRRRHHTRVHVHNLGNGDIEWTTPSGKVYVTHPMNQLVFGTPEAPGVWKKPSDELGEGEGGERLPF